MPVKAGARVVVFLECFVCTQEGVQKRFPGVFRYITQKNRQNKPTPLELKKFCPFCLKHTVHKERKK